RRVRHDVAPDAYAPAVHDEGAHHVVDEAVPRDLDVVRVHEVGAVATADDEVAGDDVVRRVPDDEVARRAHAVALDSRVAHLPQLDPVAAQAERLAARALDVAAADDHLARPLHVHAEDRAEHANSLDAHAV